MKIEVTQTYDIPDQRIKDLLCCAFEGGSNSWYLVNDYVYPEGKHNYDYEFPYLDLPLEENGAVIIDTLEHDMEVKTLNRQAIETGLKLLSEKYPKYFQDFVQENEDAITGDLFLQLCLYGKEVFC